MLNRLLFFALIIPLMGLLTGCSPRPSDADVVAALQKAIPPYLTVTSVSFECVANAQKPGGFDLDGKATVTAKENLYESASPDELKPLNDITDDSNKYIDWLNARMKTPSAKIIGNDVPEAIKLVNFVHLDQKAGDSIDGTCKFTAEQQGDKWTVDFVHVDWPSTPGHPLSGSPPDSVAINSPGGEASLAKMKAQLATLQDFQRNSEIRIKEANRAFSVGISDWIKSGKTYPGTYQDMAFNRIRQEKIRIHFSHYEPDTLSFQGEVTFLTVHNAVMGFEGDIRDSSLNLHDMKVLKDPEELSPDDHWTLNLDENGNLSGQYPGGAITIYPHDQASQ